LSLLALDACQENLNESVSPPALTTKSDSAGQPDALEAFRGRTGIRKKGTLFGAPITYEEIAGKAVFQGDIILSPDQIGADGDTAKSAKARVRGAGLSGSHTRWPEGRIPYTIDPGLPDQSRVTNAIAHWEANTPIRFVTRTSESAFLTFRPSSSGCSSAIGRTGGEQFIELDAGCGQGAVIHEIGHAVGLFHEQTRKDRDNHVNINWWNIKEGKDHNFEKYTSRGYTGFDYRNFDFASVMMYSPFQYAKDDRYPTITRKDGRTDWTRSKQLSFADKATVTAMYGHLYALNGTSIWTISEIDGKYAQVKFGDGLVNSANSATSMAEDGDALWYINGGVLYKSSCFTGVTSTFSSGWDGAVGVTGITGGNTRWAIWNGNLYAINGSGEYKKAGTRNWSGTKALFAHGNHLFAVSADGLLLRVDLDHNFRVVELNGGWSAVKAIAAADPNDIHIYIVEGRHLWRVHLGTGAYTRVSNPTTADWTKTTHMVGMGGFLYMITDGSLFKTNCKDGSWTRISETGDWWGTQSLGVIRGR
jgi:hypothetical protein